jgi:hypothetical protein
MNSSSNVWIIIKLGGKMDIKIHCWAGSSVVELASNVQGPGFNPLYNKNKLIN